MLSSLRHACLAAVVLGLAACGGGGSSTPSAPISIAFSTAPPTSMALDARASVAALVSNDPSGGGVTWKLTCSSTDCGSLSASSTPSGAVTTYTAPATLPSPPTVSITATAASGGAQVAGAVAVVAAATPALADGTYVYHLAGTDGSSPYTVAGSFAVAAGKLVGGEQDFSDAEGGYTDILVAATSSLSIAGGNIQIVLDTGDTAIGVNGVETLRGTVVSSSRVLLSEFDVSATGTGSLDLQHAAGAAEGGYAFAVSGTDVHGNNLALGGVLDFNAGILVKSASVFDISVFNPGTNTSSTALRKSFLSGSVSQPDQFGRVVISLAPSVESGVPALALAGYVVDGSRIQLVESAEANDVLNANTGGAALGQGANTGAFTANSDSVLNQSYAHGSTGIDSNGAATMAGAFALNANGLLGGVLALADGNNAGAWQLGGTYTVDASGRVEVSVNSLTSPTTGAPAAALTFVLYLDGNGNAMVLGADGFQSTQGIAFEQGALTLAGNYALSAQGIVAVPDGLITWNAVGPVQVDAGMFHGTTDYSGTAPQSAVPLGGSQDATRGVLHLTGLNPVDPAATTGYGYYPLSGNRLWAIEVDGNGLSLLLLEGVSP
jgi:hypothetical protein